MTPDEIAAFRARMGLDIASDNAIATPTRTGEFTREMEGAPVSLPTTGTDMSPGSTGPNVMGRAQAFGESMLGAGTAGVLGYGTNGGLSAAGIGRREPTSFTREMEGGGPAWVELKPVGEQRGLDGKVFNAEAPVDVPRTAPLQNPVARAGSGMGGGGGTSPLGGLQRDLKNAQMNQFGTFNTEKDLVEQRSDQAEERVNRQAFAQEIDAARKARDAEVQAKHDQEAAARHDAFLARNEQLANEIGEKQIDPGRFMRDQNAAQKIGWLIAGALSGAAGQGQQFLTRLDGMIDRDVKAQMADADNKKAKVQARASLFNQMMAESGDRRVAADQSRALMYRAVAQKMQADAERSGIPEAKTNAQLMMTEIDEKKINPLDVSMKQNALTAYQQQAAAAAAAQRAAEERAWSRSMQVAELGLKKDAQEIERKKLDAKDRDDVNAETAKLGSALADPKLAQGRAAVENSKRRLGINEDGTVKVDENGKPVVDQSEGLPGVGGMADFREKIAGRPQGLNALNPGAWVANKAIGLSDEERVSRGDMEKMALAYQNQVTGAGGSVEEQAKIRKAFLGASTPAEQRAAVSEADAMFRQIEARQKAGVSPEARRTFEARLNGLDPHLPASVKKK